MRRCLQFVIITFALTWIPMLILIGAGADVSSGPPQVVFGVAACGPSVAAGVLWLRFRRERRPFRRPGWRVMALGLVIGAAIPVLPAIALHVGDESVITANAASVVAGVGGLTGFVGLTLLTGPIAEEFGWRGYLQPRLRRRFGVFATWAIIGPIWALWHLPLFFLPGTDQQRAGLLSVRGLGLLFGLVVFSLVLLFLVEGLHGGVVAAVAAHFGFNGADALMPEAGAAAMLGQGVVLVLLAAVVVLIYGRRITAGPPSGPSHTATTTR